MRYVLALINEERGWDDVSPEEMKAVMDKWAALDDELVEAGVWRAGDALQPSATATTVKVTESEPIVTDGPFAESKEQLGGFYLLECENLDEALAWAKKVPLGPGGSIEVRPVMTFEEYGYVHPSERVK